MGAMSTRGDASPSPADAGAHPHEGHAVDRQAAQLQGILDTASEGVLAVDESRIIVMANRAAAEMFRRRVDALVGSSLDLLIPPRLRERHAAQVDAFRAGAQAPRRMGHRGPLTGLRANGEEFALEAGISQARVDGRHLCTVILRDLSASRRVEADLDRSRRLLAATFGSAGVGMVHIDARTRRLVAANAAFVSLTGYSEQELLGMDVDRVNHPQDPLDIERFQRLLRTGGPYEVDKRIVRKDGGVRWVHVSGSVVQDPAGAPSRVIGVVQDVTERHAAEQALLDREARHAFVIALGDHLERLVDHSRIVDDTLQRLSGFLGAVCVGWAEDPHGDGRLSSEACHGPAGGDPDLSLSLPRPGPAVLDELHRGRTVAVPDVRHHDRLDAAAVSAYRRLGIVATAFVPMHRDGRLRAMLAVHLTSPCDWPAHLVGFLEDVAQRLWAHAERARAEQRSHVAQAELAAALASMNDAVCISDTEGRLVEINDAFATFHRIPAKSLCPASLRGYTDLLEVRTADGAEAPVESWAVPRALRGEVASSVEYRLRRRDTGESWIGSYSFAPIRDAGGHIVGSVVSARDVTALHGLRTDLESSHRELRRLVAARDQVQEQERLRIARELHDDLQQGLAAMLMEVAVARGARADAAAVAVALDRIEHLAIEAVASMRRIVHDLRPPALEQHGIVDALHVLAEDFTRLTGLACEVDASRLHASLPAALAPVALCLYRAVQEALTNVSRHARASQVRIRLWGPARGPVVLEVVDDGVGLAPGDDAKPGSYGLLGMRERVRAAGGTLRVRGRPGEGTAVRVEMPVPATPPDPGVPGPAR